MHYAEAESKILLPCIPSFCTLVGEVVSTGAKIFWRKALLVGDFDGDP